MLARLPKRLRLVVLAAAAYVAWLALSRIIGGTSDSQLVPLDGTDIQTVVDPLLADKQPILTSDQRHGSPKASIIVIWEGQFPYAALIHFFNSFQANAPDVELIWIGVHKDSGDTCMDVTPYLRKGTNIKTACLSRQEYWTIHRDYFCGVWKCTEREREIVLQTFLERNDLDHNKSMYRIWRGYIFRHLVDSRSTWWGWADVDIHLGSFQSMFPWDVAPDFDVLMPAMPDKILYMRGHLAFIQTRKQTEEKMFLFENMTSIDGFINKHKNAYWCTEESEFSAFFIRDPRINFLILPHHLADTADVYVDTAAISSLQGTYHLTLPQNQRADSTLPALTLPTRPSAFVPTFSDAGVTNKIEIFAGNYSEGKWFPAEWVTWYTPDFSDDFGHLKVRYVGRGGKFEGGSQGVWERVEPPRPAARVKPVKNNRMQAELTEGMYVHWFHVKHEHADAFKAMPARPLKDSEAIVEFFDGRLEIWNTETGQIIWRSDQASRDAAKKKHQHHGHRWRPSQRDRLAPLDARGA